MSIAMYVLFFQVLHWIVLVCSQNVAPDSIVPTEDLPQPELPAGIHNVAEGELLLRKTQKKDSRALLSSLTLARIPIPLCRMISMPKVRPVSEVEIQKLENEFVHGYREGDRVLYVSVYDYKGKSRVITEKDMETWDPHWIETNERFEELLSRQVHLQDLHGKMFFVWDGNHRYSAWWRHINMYHADEEDWHYSVDTFVIDPRGNAGDVLNAMNDINW